MIDDNDDSDSSGDEDDASMMDDEAALPQGMVMDNLNSSKLIPDADGWAFVPPRRGHNKN